MMRKRIYSYFCPGCKKIIERRDRIENITGSPPASLCGKTGKITKLKPQGYVYTRSTK